MQWAGVQVLVASDLEIRTWFSQTDLADDVLAVMSQSHRRTITRGWLEAKLSWGLGGVAALAYDGERPVGLVLFGAAPYEWDGEAIQALLSYDTFVDENYRGRGLFRQLLRRAEEACEEVGAQLLLNFPNGASRPGFEKAGWKACLPLRSFVHPSMRGSLPSQADRARRLMKGLRLPFVPIYDAAVILGDLDLMEEFEGDRSGVRFSLSAAALKYRFSPERGTGYATVLGDGVGAIVRRGDRGHVSEAQIMATTPRNLSARQSREVVRLIEAKFEPDLVSDLRGTESNSPFQALSAGYVSPTRVTTAYRKITRPYKGELATTLSGIDIHTW